MQVIVIGAGISGLACAARLAAAGAGVTVLEASPRVGGVIAGVERSGYLFELGPQSFQPTPTLSELIRDAGLEAELLAAPARAPRYVLVGGRLLPVPMGPDALVRGSLLGIGTRLRLFRDLLGRSRPPDRDESLAEFVRRKFGPELLDRLAGPFVSGIYAGDPERLGLRDAFPDLYRWEREQGSVIRGAMRSMRARAKSGARRAPLTTLRRGYASLLQTLAARLGDRVRLNARVDSLAVAGSSPGAGFQVRLAGPAGGETLAADAVVMAVPTDSAARILAPLSARLGELLAGIEYAPVAVVGTGYRRDQVRDPLQGFGFLVARSERRRLLGTVWMSSLFPGRAPEGHVNLASFVGGATDPSVVDLEPDAIAALVESELQPILGITGPAAERIVTVYRRALPQYNVGHHRVVQQLRAEAARVPGLFLAGNYLDGPSTGVCVDVAFRVAREVLRFTAAPAAG